MQQNDGSCKKEKDGRFGLFISLAKYSIDVYAVFSICEQTIIILHTETCMCASSSLFLLYHYMVCM